MNTEELQEYKVLTTALNAHTEYCHWAVREIVNPKKLKYASLAEDDKKLLPWFPQYIEQLRHSININNNFFTQVANTMGPQWGCGTPDTWFKSNNQDLEKMCGIMSQYVREWSSDGAEEREQSFGRILNAAEKFYPNIVDRQNINVLVPGAGLGRLVVEFVRRGFKTEGNELSMHMLLNSSFILNNTYCSNNFLICPFVHKSSNVEKRNYQCRQIYFPDFNPGDISSINKEYPTIPVSKLMSMIAGGFTDLYGPNNIKGLSDLYTNDPTAVSFRNENKNRFDIVATCYFLDTATNIVDYLKTIYNCLNDDGYWINFGPLLWHFENDDNVYNVKVQDDHNVKNIVTPMKGLELSKDDLIAIIKNVGFEFIEHESNIESSYGADKFALGNWKYKSEYWVCRKLK